MPDLPTGTVTFLFTDIESSTALLQYLGDTRYAEALADHRRLLRAAFEEGGGHEVDTQGDAFFVAFGRARDAVSTALAAQLALTAHPWAEGAPLRVRMGLHTGEPILAGGGYVGLDVHRAARMAAAGWGGQILLSQATRDAIEHDLQESVTLRDLGEHRLRREFPQPLLDDLRDRLIALHDGAIARAQAAAERGGDGEGHGGLPAQKIEETCAVQPQDLARPLGAHGRRARLIGQQGHLPEGLNGGQASETGLAGAVRRGGKDAEPAACDDIESVPGIALPAHGRPILEGHRLQVGGEPRERHAVQARKELDLREKLSVRGAGSVAHRRIPPCPQLYLEPVDDDV